MTTLFDAALKSTLILALAWIACAALRKNSADLRHKIWIAAFLAIAALPFVPRTLPMAQFQFTASAAPAVQSARVFPWTFAIWLSGASIVLLRTIAGIARIAWITSRAEKRDGIYFTDRIATPLTWAFAIVMPQWNEIAIRHERAHLARGDWFWQVYARIVTAIFWFHPLMWLAERALRHEAELAVDDQLLASGIDAAQYAQELLEVARGSVAAAVAMTPPLESRVRSILDSTRPRFQSGWVARASIAAAAAMVILPLAGFQDQSIHKVGESGLTAPRVIEKVEPQYTPEARDAKIEGTTVLQCVIDETGIARSIVVVRSLDSGLDAQAVNAVSQWKFAPGVKDGQPVRVQAMIEINFRLL